MYVCMYARMYVCTYVCMYENIETKGVLNPYISYRNSCMEQCKCVSIKLNSTSKNHLMVLSNQEKYRGKYLKN